MIWVLLIPAGYAALWYFSKLEEKKRNEQLVADEAARKADLDRLRKKILTSSTGSIRGRSILQQIRMISIDNELNRENAELVFLREAEKAGASGVINMTIRRSRGAYISITGDAVVLN